jgi:hypothetical protein
MSPCGLYRYELWRYWAPGRLVAWIMLNPSTADATADDPTLRRCIDFSKAWGCGGLMVVNLFGLRATDPQELRRAEDPVGPMNDHFLWGRCMEADLVVAAWGGHGKLFGRRAEIQAQARARGLALHYRAFYQRSRTSRRGLSPRCPASRTTAGSSKFPLLCSLATAEVQSSMTADG